MSRRLSAVLALSVLVAAATLLGEQGQAAAADSATLEQMEKLNRDALAAYRVGRHEMARGLLLDAEMLAETNGLLRNDMAARTYLHLGIVHLNGLGQRDKALRYFAQALQIRPESCPPGPWLRGNVRSAIAEARRRQKQLLSKSTSLVATVGKDKERPLAETQPAAAAQPDDPDAEAEVDNDAADVEESDADLYCPVPPVAPPGHEIEVLCRTPLNVSAQRAFLFYRTAGQKDYTALRMVRDGKDYVASIPGSDVVGRTLELYVEAEEAQGQVMASLGGLALPKVIALRPGALPAGRMSLADLRGGSALLTGRDPTEEELRERARESQQTLPDRVRRAPGTWFIGLGLGTGMGAHLGRSLEHHSQQTVSTGMAAGGLLHLMPEVGYQFSERLALSLQSRHQYIRPSGGPDPTVMGLPPQTAHALLARAYYALSDGEWVQLMATATVGGGSGFRLKIAPVPVAGLASSDTISGGPVVAGPGLSLFINLSEHTLLAAELRALVGFNRIAAIAEGSLGIQYGF